MSTSRRADVDVFFGGVDVTVPVRQNLLSLVYTDNEDNEAYDLQLSLEDRDGVWLTQYLDYDAPSTSVPASDKNYKVIAQSGLNVRSGPGTDNPRVGGFPYGSVVEVETISAGWAKIRYGNGTAYVSADYLEKAESVEVKPATIKGLKLQASIIRRNWHSDGSSKILDCGAFELDSIDANGPPSIITIRGTALPFQSQIRQTKKNKAWESYSLSRIADEIASVNGMTCMYDSSADPHYARVEQVDKSDIAFLSQLSHEAGISLKATNNIIVLFDQAEYESKPEVITITRGDGSYENHKLRLSTVKTQYTSARVRYIDPDTGQLIQASATTSGRRYSGGNSSQHLEINAKVKDFNEAKAMAENALRVRNNKERTASFAMQGNPDLLAGVTVKLEGWGLWNGKYIVSKAIHSVSSSGYTTQVTLRHTVEGY